MVADGEVIVDGEWLYLPWEHVDMIRAVFLVTSNDVTIRGFTVVNTFFWGTPGILLYDEEDGRPVNNCRIERNKLQNNRVGVLVIGFNNIVEENTFTYNMFDIMLGGLGADTSGFNVVEDNTITSDIGILVHVNSNHNTIKKNSISDTSAGVLLDGHHNTILKNAITNNYKGIIAFSDNNTVIGNVLSDNRDYGIHLYGSSWCNVRDNIVSNSGRARAAIL